MKSTLIGLIGLLVLAGVAFASEPPHQHIFFKNLKDGAIVHAPFKIEMGNSGIDVAPAGEIKEGFGHHHLLIGLDSIPKGEVIPADEKHLHFGKGQTETELNLPPGKHKLTLQFADGVHRSYGPEYSQTIEIEVKG